MNQLTGVGFDVPITPAIFAASQKSAACLVGGVIAFTAEVSGPLRECQKIRKDGLRKPAIVDLTETTKQENPPRNESKAGFDRKRQPNLCDLESGELRSMRADRPDRQGLFFRHRSNVVPAEHFQTADVSVFEG